jgi:hypothetical protein
VRVRSNSYLRYLLYHNTKCWWSYSQLYYIQGVTKPRDTFGKLSPMWCLWRSFWMTGWWAWTESKTDRPTAIYIEDKNNKVILRQSFKWAGISHREEKDKIIGITMNGCWADRKMLRLSPINPGQSLLCTYEMTHYNVIYSALTESTRQKGFGCTHLQLHSLNLNMNFWTNKRGEISGINAVLWRGGKHVLYATLC